MVRVGRYGSMINLLKMIKRIKEWVKSWWKRNIVDGCPPELEEYEFSDKYRKHDRKRN